MSLVQLLDTGIDHRQLWSDVQALLDTHRLWGSHQVSLTSETGDDDWQCSVGRLVDLPQKEEVYSVINRSLRKTYLAECIERYPQYYRWRLMRIKPKRTYSIHSDNLNPFTRNLRIHIPVTTNHQCWMYFYEKMPQNAQSQTVSFYHLQAGCSYEANTTGLHCAANHGDTDRYHIVGVRYEKRKPRDTVE
jgi:hypothetical protein